MLDDLARLLLFETEPSWASDLASETALCAENNLSDLLLPWAIALLLDSDKEPPVAIDVATDWAETD